METDRPTSFAMKQIPHRYESHGCGVWHCRVCDLSEAHWAHAVPPEAGCQLPTPHRPHRHEITWGDLVGGYWCEGAQIDGLEGGQ